jgi:hypothetical protein
MTMIITSDKCTFPEIWIVDRNAYSRVLVILALANTRVQSSPRLAYNSVKIADVRNVDPAGAFRARITFTLPLKSEYGICEVPQANIYSSMSSISSSQILGASRAKMLWWTALKDAQQCFIRCSIFETCENNKFRAQQLGATFSITHSCCRHPAATRAEKSGIKR